MSSADEVPAKDILMVMDCDHMVKPDIFNKMAPCMLDEAVAVTLVPQWFHNLIFPDAFDSANADFMFSKMPYCFGAGMCYITGVPSSHRRHPAPRRAASSPGPRAAGGRDVPTPNATR